MCVKAGGGHFEHYFRFRHSVFSNNYLLSLISWTLARKWIGRFGSIAVVSYDVALCFGHCLDVVHKVKQRHWLGEENFCCVSIFALVTIFLAKNHTIYLNCQSYVQRTVGPFFPGHGLRKRHFSTMSQLCHHYVVSCKYWYESLQFFSHTDCQDDLC